MRHEPQREPLAAQADPRLREDDEFVRDDDENYREDDGFVREDDEKYRGVLGAGPLGVGVGKDLP